MTDGRYIVVHVGNSGGDSHDVEVVGNLTIK